MSDSLQPLDCSPPDSSVHGILQAWILEWVDIPFSRESARPSLPHCRQILYRLSHQLKHTKKTIIMKIQVSVSDPMCRSWLWSDLRRDQKPSKGKGALSLFPAFSCLACSGPWPWRPPSAALGSVSASPPGPALFFSCHADHICFSGCTCPNIATLAQFSRSLVQEIEWALKTFNSVQSSVMSNSLWPHESQHARPPCPSPTPGFYSNPCPIESEMPSSHLILCRPLLLPPIPPSIRVFSNKSSLRMK